MKRVTVLSLSLVCSLGGNGVEAIADSGFTTSCTEACGDVNSDGTVNVADAFVIARGQPLMCPVGGACASGSDIVSFSWLQVDITPEVTIQNTWTNVSRQTFGIVDYETTDVWAEATGVLCDAPTVVSSDTVRQVTIEGQTVAAVEPFRGTLTVDGVPYDMTLRVAGSTALRYVVETTLAGTADTQVQTNTRFAVLVALESAGAVVFEGLGMLSRSVINTPAGPGQTAVQGEDMLEADLVGAEGVVRLRMDRDTLAIVGS